MPLVHRGAIAGTVTEEEVDAALAKQDLKDFVKQTWDLVEDVPLVWNWHIDVICEALEAVTRGDIKRLLINIPPGCMKSYLVSVFWPAWEWATRPELRYLTASYNADLAIRDNLRVRDIVTSEWYQRHFPGTRLLQDRNVKVLFHTTAKGFRMASSVGGKATGEHPDRIVIDDALSELQARSDQYLTGCRRWFDRTISTRGVARGVATVVIMQRLHEEDLAGHILGKQGWTHICLPMRYETERESEPDWRPDPKDIRSEPGELLWPRLFTEEMVRQLELDLGPYGTAGQLQQRPSPEGGGLFKREWFEYVDAAPIEADRCRGWDTAATAGGGDYTAGPKLARSTLGIWYVEDVKLGQWGPAGVDAAMLAAAQEDGKETLVREEREGGASGKAQIVARAKLLEGFDYAEELVSGDKTVRAGPFRAQCEAGNVKIVRGPWNERYIAELTAFGPGCAHDDQVDGSSCAFNALMAAKPKRSGAALW